MNKVKDNQEIKGDKTFLEDLEIAIENVTTDYVVGYTLHATIAIKDLKIKNTHFTDLIFS